MKTTSIFPVNGLASLILMSKYAQSRQFLRGFPDIIDHCQEIPGEIHDLISSHEYYVMTWVLSPGVL